MGRRADAFPLPLPIKWKDIILCSLQPKTLPNLCPRDNGTRQGGTELTAPGMEVGPLPAQGATPTGISSCRIAGTMMELRDIFLTQRDELSWHHLVAVSHF